MTRVANAKAWITLVLVGLVPLGTAFLLGQFFPDWRWEHHPVHALVEGTGALIAVIVAALICLMLRTAQGAPALLWVACALLGMGILDGFHAATHAGRLFVWLHSVANFVGGLLFACVCLPDAIARRHGLRKLPVATIVIATYVGVLSIALPEQLPKMTDALGFTFTAKALNFLGGVGFLAAAWCFVRRYAATSARESLLFANHCLLFGVAGLVFVGSSLWDASWWLWHFLRLTAYLVVLIYFFDRYREAFQTARETALGLEYQVAERTRELMAGLEARRRAEEALQEAHAKLEQRVAERTHELSRANAALESRARQLRALTEAALAINAAGSFEDLMQVLADQAREVIGAHQAVVSFTRDRNWAQVVTGLSLSDKYAAYRTYDVKPDGSGIYSLVCETNRPMRMTQAELESHPRWRGFGAEAGRHPPMVGWLAVPLLASDGSNLGLVQLSDKYEGEFTEEDQHLLSQLANIGASALEVRKARAELEVRVRERTAELRASKERMDLALASSGVGTWDWNVLGNAIACDDYLPPLFGLAPGKFPEKLEDFLAILHPEDRQRVKEEVAAAVNGDAPYDTEYRVIWPDGSIHVVGARGKLYRDGQGRPVKMTGVCWDETARKRAEEELRRVAMELARSNAELEQFAYIASHDLQEPLRKVQAFGDLLATTAGPALDEKSRLYVERMQDAAQRMQRLINDLLTFARVNSQTRAFVEVELTAVAREVLSDLENRLRTTGGRVELSDLPKLEGDPTQLRQLLQNLIGNALKFHREGVPPLVRLHGRLIPNGNSALLGHAALAEITVADNGIGFEEKYTDQIFAPFKRLHGHGKYEGTGMGLAICRKIVERHGGSITARSTPGQGTTFTISLPLRQPRGGQRYA